MTPSSIYSGVLILTFDCVRSSSADTCRSIRLWAPQGAFTTSGTRSWLGVQRHSSSWMLTSARHSRSQIWSNSRRTTDNQTVLSSLGQQWEFITYTGLYWILKCSKIGFVLCQRVGGAQLTVPILSFQSNRKQSMNYGCIVENEETHEVLKRRWGKTRHPELILTQALDLFFKGPALCGKAEHVCEWHHQLRHLPLHPGHLSAHRRCFPEEPAGHVAVSHSWFFVLWVGICAWKSMSVPCFNLIWLSSFVLFPPSTPWFLFPYTIISYPFDG